MSNEANTLTKLQRVPYDHAAWIATDVVRPGIALVESCGTVSCLLAKNFTDDRDKATLHAVRWIQIPQGVRLWLLHFAATVQSARLPDEWLFNEVSIRCAKREAFVIPGGPVLTRQSKGEIPLRELSHGQFDHLSHARGRSLYYHLIAIFPDELRQATRPLIPLISEVKHWIGLRTFSIR